MLETGTTAPDFTLPNTDKEPVSLADLRANGPVLVAFYPAAFSGVCDAEMCAFRDAMAAYNQMKTTVVGISVDLPWSNKAFKERHGIEFPLLSDFNHEVIKAYDVVFSNFGHIEGLDAAVRSLFVVDAGGIIQWTWKGEHPGIEPDYDAVQAAVAAVVGS
jgi:peroxiredoxin